MRIRISNPGENSCPRPAGQRIDLAWSPVAQLVVGTVGKNDEGFDEGWRLLVDGSVQLVMDDKQTSIRSKRVSFKFPLTERTESYYSSSKT
jgi:hypothetical protein